LRLPIPPPGPSGYAQVLLTGIPLPVKKITPLESVPIANVIFQTPGFNRWCRSI